MKIERRAITFGNVVKGTTVVLYQDHVVAESQEEIDELMELRQAATHTEADADGSTTTWRSAMVTDYPLFKGRVVVPHEPVNGKENAGLLSQQAMKVMLGKYVSKGTAEDLAFRPIDPSPDIEGGFACVGGEMNGMPCVTTVSKDRQRGITVASRKHEVIDAVLDRVLGHTRMDSGEGGNNNARMERWDSLTEHMEILAITVRRVDQAFNALRQYRVYLDDLIANSDFDQ